MRRYPARVHLGRGVEATFLAADPPRHGRLALWGGDDELATDGEVELALRTGSTVRRRRVAARMLTVTEAIEMLVRPVPEDVADSLRVWAAATLAGLGLIAHGRLLPARSSAGHGAWRVGQLDVAEVAWLNNLAAAMPATSHAVPLAGTRPLTVSAPDALVREFWDAIADTVVRTAAADVGGTAPAFTAVEPVTVTGDTGWLGDTDRTRHAGARTVLRVEPFEPEPPDDAEGDDEPGDTWDDDGAAFRGVLQLRSVADPSLIVDVSDVWTAPAAVLARMGEEAEIDLLLSLRRGARAWPPMAAVLEADAPVDLPLTDTHLDELLGDAAEALDSAGIEVLWPTDLLSDGVRLKASTTEAPTSVAGAGFSLASLLEFRWQPTLDGEPLTDEEIAVLAAAKRPLVRLRGRWVKVDAELLDRLRRKGKRRITTAEALAAAMTGVLEVDGERVEFHAAGPIADLAERLRSAAGGEASAREVAPSPDLRAELRPYQRRGLSWLAEMTSLGLGACLADDMGLGKTVQLIALHLHRRALDAGPTLVVCPTSLLGNWQRELARFAPGTPVRRFHGGDRHLDDVRPDEVVLVTYGLLRRDVDVLAEVGWGLLVADEVQHAKNPLSRTAKALRTVPAAAKVALTGTPVENRLSELWAILDWTTPGILGPLERFRRTVAVPVERYRDPDATSRLAALVRPFLLRRRKIDPGIAPELPAKTETDVVVPLSSEQGTLYQAVVDETLAKIAGSEGIERRGLVLSLLTSLKQVCNHPAQYLHERGPLVGRSGKLAAVDELLEVILDERESVLVFSQYVEMCRLLERHLAAKGVPTLFLHGQVPARRREEMVAAFQRGDAPVFLLSLKAGGVGLNLTRATHVVHYDRWWNPAVEDQATDRAYRIGQDRPVQVHRLVAENTLEDRIATLLAAKRDLAEAVVGAGESWLTELGDAELADLVRLGSTS